MESIAIWEPNTAKPGQLRIAVVVRLLSGLHQLAEIRYTDKGLYLVPSTYKLGVDLHTSYHPSGKIHQKLTRGTLKRATGRLGGDQPQTPKVESLGEARPHTQDNETVLWKGRGQRWNQLKGVVPAFGPPQSSQVLTNIAAVAAGYPTIKKSDADYVFELDVQSMPTPWIDIEYLLVEPGNTGALEDAIHSMIDGWRRARESMRIERAEIFTNQSPWLAIVLLSSTGHA